MQDWSPAAVGSLCDFPAVLPGAPEGLGPAGRPLAQAQSGSQRLARQYTLVWGFCYNLSEISFTRRIVHTFEGLLPWFVVIRRVLQPAPHLRAFSSFSPKRKLLISTRTRTVPAATDLPARGFVCSEHLTRVELH